MEISVLRIPGISGIRLAGIWGGILIAENQVGGFIFLMLTNQEIHFSDTETLYLERSQLFTINSGISGYSKYHEKNHFGTQCIQTLIDLA